MLEHAVRWVSYAGRTTDVIDKAMPLVRFPLVSILKLPSALKTLQARSEVVKELIKEALKYQVGQVGLHITKKHPLLALSIDARSDNRRGGCGVYGDGCSRCQ